MPDEQQSSSVAPHVSPGWIAAALACGAMLLYLATLAPDVLWGGGDFAVFQRRANLLELESGVFAHPLWVLLAHPFTRLPIRNPAWRANFASAVFAVGALLTVFDIARRLTRSILAALLGTTALAVSHTFWTYAVLPKVYSLNSLLLGLCIYLLILWRESRKSVYLYGFVVVFGVSLFNHLVMATAVVGFAAFVLGETLSRWRVPASRRELLISFFLACLCLLPHVLSSTESSAGAGSSDAVRAYLMGGLRFLVTPRYWLKGIGLGVTLLWYQFPLMIVAGAIGYLQVRSSDRRVWWLLVLVSIGNIAFVLASADLLQGSDYIWNLHWYHPTYLVVSLLIAAGAKTVISYLRDHGIRRAVPILVCLTLLVPVVCYSATPAIARVVMGDMIGFRPLPGRDNFVFALSPWKHQETGARVLGERLLDGLPEGSVLFADYSLWAIVRYLQVVEHQRPDVVLIEMPHRGAGQVEAILDHTRGDRPLYLADTWRYYDLEHIEQLYRVVPEGDVYRLAPREE